MFISDPRCALTKKTDESLQRTLEWLKGDMTKIFLAVGMTEELATTMVRGQPQRPTTPPPQLSTAPLSRHPTSPLPHRPATPLLHQPTARQVLFSHAAGWEVRGGPDTTCVPPVSNSVDGAGEGTTEAILRAVERSVGDVYNTISQLGLSPHPNKRQHQHPAALAALTGLTWGSTGRCERRSTPSSPQPLAQATSASSSC